MFITFSLNHSCPVPVPVPLSFPQYFLNSSTVYVSLYIHVCRCHAEDAVRELLFKVTAGGQGSQDADSGV